MNTFQDRTSIIEEDEIVELDSQASEVPVNYAVEIHTVRHRPESSPSTAGLILRDVLKYINVFLRILLFLCMLLLYISAGGATAAAAGLAIQRKIIGDSELYFNVTTPEAIIVLEISEKEVAIHGIWFALIHYAPWILILGVGGLYFQNVRKRHPSQRWRPWMIEFILIPIIMPIYIFVTPFLASIYLRQPYFPLFAAFFPAVLANAWISVFHFWFPIFAPMAGGCMAAEIFGENYDSSLSGWGTCAAGGLFGLLLHPAHINYIFVILFKILFPEIS